MIGDGRELTGSEQTLSFDGATGAWTLTEPEPDGPKTPERTEILDLLKASAEPMSPKQIARTLGKNASTISMLLAGMVRAGDIKLARYGKYIPTDSADSTDSSSLKEHMKKNHLLSDGREDDTESVESAESVPVPASAPVAEAVLLVAQASSLPATSRQDGGATGDAPPADVMRFAQMVADCTHSRLDSASMRRVPEPQKDKREFGV